MKILKSLLPHFFIASGSFLLSCLLLALTRNLLEFEFPFFEEIVLVSIVAAALTLFLTFHLKKIGIFKDSILLLSYVNLIGLLISVLILPYSLLNVDRSRSFYVLSWVHQGKISQESGRLLIKVKSSESTDVAGVQFRIFEQQQRGLIREINGRYEVTGIGELTIGIANTLSGVFNLKNWEANKN